MVMKYITHKLGVNMVTAYGHETSMVTKRRQPHDHMLVCLTRPKKSGFKNKSHTRDFNNNGRCIENFSILAEHIADVSTSVGFE